MMDVRATATVALLAALGCGGITIPEDEPFQEGVIVERDRQPSFGTDNPTISVKNHPEDVCSILYVVDPRTDVWARTDGGEAQKRPVEDLQIGVRVAVWTRYLSGSCPAEGQASSIEILGG